MKTKYLIIGRTASGKSTVAKRMCELLGIKQIVSFTTRPPRCGEIENGDHFFISNEEADRILENEEIAAYTEIGGNRYFTTKKTLDERDVYVIDPAGVHYLNEKYGKEYDLCMIYVSASKETRKKRYMEREGASEDAFWKRENAETAQFDSFEKTYDGLYIDNDAVSSNKELSDTIIKLVNVYREFSAHMWRPE